MNFKLAREILEVSASSSPETIRKQYKLKALKYHPDKNKSPTAAEDFRNIHEAYKYLISPGRESDNEIPKYRDVLFSFLSTFMNTSSDHVNQSSPQSEEPRDSKMKLIFSCLLNMCEAKAIEYVQKLDISTIEKIISVIEEYGDIFHFTDVFVEKIREIIIYKREKQKSDYKYLILNPFLEDLFQDNLYRFTLNNKTYIVPLWHQELIYDNSGEEIVVQCYPVLPENIEIDENNNVIVEIHPLISEVFNKPDYLVKLPGKDIILDCTYLQLHSKMQTIVLKQEGISRVDSDNIFNVSDRSDIIIHIWLLP
jgi:hypothetical protein